MTTHPQTTTRTTASGGLEWAFAGEQPDPHAKAIERIRLVPEDQRGPAADRRVSE